MYYAYFFLYLSDAGERIIFWGSEIQMVLCMWMLPYVCWEVGML